MQDLRRQLQEWKAGTVQTHFAPLVEAGLAEFGLSQRELAEEFEVAESTVSRWCRGTTSPAKLVQKQVVAYFEKKMQRRKRSGEESRVAASLLQASGAAAPARSKEPDY